MNYGILYLQIALKITVCFEVGKIALGDFIRARGDF